MVGITNGKSFKAKRLAKRQSKDEEIAKLEERISLNDFGNVDDKRFECLPMSRTTLDGLKYGKYNEMTDIQRASLNATLAGRDVLGAAKTGSGKTLAFLIPVLEILYRKRWTRFDKLGALVISPTRELACQIFEVLKRVGKFHELSAGLVIGGKSLKEEQELISRMNILIGTPGRLLQHMDQTAGFDCTNIQLLVLDEADRILDMGFEKTMNAIIQNLSKERQTLLFSATQTKSVRDLARLSLSDPDYIAVHEKAEHSTPSKLRQYYTVCPLEEKLDLVYSFLKKHLQSKMLIFVSSCKQVRYFYETFKRMRPGIPWMCLHGKQKQHSRLEIFEQFSRMKHAALLCTDIAGRGLDFPAVDWVVQLDCPEDGETYIHRVGRTARYESSGSALLILCPSEEKGMLEILHQKKVPIEKMTSHHLHEALSVQKQLAALCSQDSELKYLAQKAFISYVRSVHFHKNKAVFDVSKLSLEAYAASLGLPGTPKIKLIKKSDTAKKNMPYLIQKLDIESSKIDLVTSVDTTSHQVSDGTQEPKSEKPRTRIEKLFARKNQNVLSEHYMKLHAVEELETPAEELLSFRRKNHDLHDLPDMDRVERLSKRDLRKMRQKHRIRKNEIPERLIFDEDGNAHPSWKLEELDEFLREDPEEKKMAYISRLRQNLKTEDVLDKQTQKFKLKEKRSKRKLLENDKRELVSESPMYSNESIMHQEEESEFSSDDKKLNADRRDFLEFDSDQESGSPKNKRWRAETLEAQEALALHLLQA